MNRGLLVLCMVFSPNFPLKKEIRFSSMFMKHILKRMVGFQTPSVSLHFIASLIIGIFEWSLSDKLEQSSAVPWNFYAYHEAYTRGATRWLSSLTKSEWPEKEGPSYHWTYFKSHAKVKYNRGPKNKDYFGRDDLDFSPQHLTSKAFII